MELAVGQVPEHGLAVAPLQPGSAEEQYEQQAGEGDPQVAVEASETACMDATGHLAFALVGGGGNLDDSEGDSLAHGSSLIRPRSGQGTMARDLFSAQAQVSR